MYFYNPRLAIWASDIDQGTILQAEKMARMDIVADHISLMPDAHVGMGSTVGCVFATENTVIPSAVGVDIGCGMIASKMNLTVNDFGVNTDEDIQDIFRPLLPKIEAVIPAGVGEAHQESSKAAGDWVVGNTNHSKFSQKQMATALTQLGTLGSGNHFFEICLDQNDQIWIILHSGSRGIGNQLASVHMDNAKKLMRELNTAIEDINLAYLTQGTPEFQAYIEDMTWAQEYAFVNRQLMMDAAVKAFKEFVKKTIGRPTNTVTSEDTINCHHNFTQSETHHLNGEEAQLWITRKGAIKADIGDRGIIPGSMGTKSYIVSGLGNAASWNSCSHGAGRKMSRSAAKSMFTTKDLKEQMGGRVWLEDKAKGLVDEIPSSYKDIDQVMADQQDLVAITHTLRQILNFKGAK